MVRNQDKRACAQFAVFTTSAKAFELAQMAGEPWPLGHRVVDFDEVVAAVVPASEAIEQDSVFPALPRSQVRGHYREALDAIEQLNLPACSPITCGADKRGDLI